MKISCSSNNINVVPSKLRRFAFMQDEDGIVPLTPDQAYTAYGFRKGPFTDFYLVLRDGEDLPWWMPADFFYKPQQIDIPGHWHKESYVSDQGEAVTVYAPKAFIDNEDDVEDGTNLGYKIFKSMWEAER